MLRTTLTTDHHRTRFRQRFTLMGEVTAEGSCSGPYTVEVSKRVHGRSRSRVVARPRTDDRGTWGVKLRSPRSASYVGVVDTNGRDGEMSSPVDVLVQAKVKVFRLRRLERSCDPAQPIAGKVRPRYRGSKVRLGRKVKGSWRIVDRDRLNGRSRFRLEVRRCKGTYRVEWPSQDDRNARAARTFRLR